MRIFCWIALVAVMSGVSSCKKTEQKSKTISLSKTTWKFSDLTSPTPKQDILAELERKKEFLLDQEITFNEDMTFASSFALSTDPSSKSTGTWELSPDETMLKIVDNGNGMTWNVGRLDDTILELKGHDQNLDVDVRYVYKRKEIP